MKKLSLTFILAFILGISSLGLVACSPDNAGGGGGDNSAKTVTADQWQAEISGASNYLFETIQNGQVAIETKATSSLYLVKDFVRNTEKYYSVEGGAYYVYENEGLVWSKKGASYIDLMTPKTGETTMKVFAPYFQYFQYSKATGKYTYKEDSQHPTDGLLHCTYSFAFKDGKLDLFHAHLTNGVKVNEIKLTQFGKIQLTAPVTSSAEDLKSEVVNETGWRSAFSVENMNNVSVLAYINDNYGDYEATSPENTFREYGRVKAKGNNMLVNYSGWENKIEELENGTINVYDNGVLSDTFLPTEADYQLQLEVIAVYKKALYSDFSEFFSKFSYNEERGSYMFYSLEEPIASNRLFEEDDAVFHFAEVKIINGKIAYLRCGQYNAGYIVSDIVVHYFNYGTTSIG